LNNGGLSPRSAKRAKLIAEGDGDVDGATSEGNNCPTMPPELYAAKDKVTTVFLVPESQQANMVQYVLLLFSPAMAMDAKRD